MYYIVNQARRKGSKKHIMRKVATLSDITLSDFNDNYIQSVYTGNWKEVGVLNYEYSPLLNSKLWGKVTLHLIGKDCYKKLGEWEVKTC